MHLKQSYRYPKFCLFAYHDLTGIKNVQGHLHIGWPITKAFAVFRTMKVPETESILFTDDSES